jgi:hypothetical protein
MPEALNNDIHMVIPLFKREAVPFLAELDNLRDMLVDMDALAISSFGKVEVHKVGKIGHNILAIPSATRCQPVAKEIPKEARAFALSSTYVVTDGLK